MNVAFSNMHGINDNDNANEHDEMNKGIKLDEDIVQKN